MAAPGGSGDSSGTEGAGETDTGGGFWWGGGSAPGSVIQPNDSITNQHHRRKLCFKHKNPRTARTSKPSMGLRDLRKLSPLTPKLLLAPGGLGISRVLRATAGTGETERTSGGGCGSAPGSVIVRSVWSAETLQPKTDHTTGITCQFNLLASLVRPPAAVYRSFLGSRKKMSVCFF